MQNVRYLELEDIKPDGSLKDYVTDGKPVILMCQGNFCGYCQQAKPDYSKFAKNNNHVILATIVTDGSKSEQDAATKFIKKWDPKHRGVPSYLGFGSDGRFKTVHDGGRGYDDMMTFSRILVEK